MAEAYGEIDVPALARAIAAGDASDLAALFQATGAQPPRLVWRPDPAILGDAPELSLLAEHWATRGGPAAGYDAVDPFALRGALGVLMVLDVVADVGDGRGPDFRYRLYGSRIAERSGVDLTGELVSRLAPRSPLSALMFRASYQAALLRGELLFTEHAAPRQFSATRWLRLIAPLRGPDGAFGRLLVGNVPTVPRRGDPLETPVSG